MAEWPSFPDVYTLLECPTGAVCISEGDHVRIVGWINQVERIHQHLVETCPQVQWRELPEVPNPRPEPWDPNPFPGGDTEE